MTENKLQIVTWNVAHGSASYAKTPNGRSILFDAGSSEEFSPANWLYEKYGLRETDLFILSHTHADHISDIENVGNLIKPKVLIRNKSVPKNLAYPEFPPIKNPHKYYYEVFDKPYSQTVTSDSPESSSQASNWGGVKIKTFFNSLSEKFTKLNDYSVVTFLLFGNLEYLLPGDLEEPGWNALMEENPDFLALSTPSRTNINEVRILVAAHHGREAGVYKPFLDLYQPHLTIVSDKYGSSYTAYPTYYQASQGYAVYDWEKKTTTTRRVLTTKVNYMVLVSASGSDVRVTV